MDLQEFRDSVSSEQPPKNLNFALSGLLCFADLARNAERCAPNFVEFWPSNYY